MSSLIFYSKLLLGGDWSILLIAQQLLDDLLWNFVQKLMFPIRNKYFDVLPNTVYANVIPEVLSYLIYKFKDHVYLCLFRIVLENQSADCQTADVFSCF